MKHSDSLRTSEMFFPTEQIAADRGDHATIRRARDLRCRFKAGLSGTTGFLGIYYGLLRVF